MLGPACKSHRQLTEIPPQQIHWVRLGPWRSVHLSLLKHGALSSSVISWPHFLTFDLTGNSVFLQQNDLDWSGWKRHWNCLLLQLRFPACNAAHWCVSFERLFHVHFCKMGQLLLIQHVTPDTWHLLLNVLKMKTSEALMLPITFHDWVLEIELISTIKQHWTACLKEHFDLYIPQNNQKCFVQQQIGLFSYPSFHGKFVYFWKILTDSMGRFLPGKIMDIGLRTETSHSCRFACICIWPSKMRGCEGIL